MQQTRTATVLVIDDERMIRWSLEQTLRAAGYEVAVAETAAEGMLLFRRLSPAVILLDVRLPDEDGLTLLKRIKQERSRNVAVIVMTAFGESRTAIDAMHAGAYEYLEKPFDFDQLTALVSRALASLDEAQPGQNAKQEKTTGGKRGST